ncbi:hypothetical protein Salat_0437600 [Sesamum alatum]|uniref:Uncharacterized protein n=1 Tax=Sesamum alatum TaxID=300844 RepID=A0AAE1Z2Y0_9LAMI|nr:hypothetical protein Salat_0437600 [Sesamum alatum]
MGTLVGHVAPGFGFFIIGLWHLFNHIKFHALHPKTYTSYPWFPTSRIKYLELYLIMLGCSISISMELFIGPDRHQPLDPDGTIPSNHLHNFEHSNISLTFFVYAFFSILLDRLATSAQYELTCLLGAWRSGNSSSSSTSTPPITWGWRANTIGYFKLQYSYHLPLPF